MILVCCFYLMLFYFVAQRCNIFSHHFACCLQFMIATYTLDSVFKQQLQRPVSCAATRLGQHCREGQESVSYPNKVDTGITHTCKHLLLISKNSVWEKSLAVYVPLDLLICLWVAVKRWPNPELNPPQNCCPAQVVLRTHLILVNAIYIFCDFGMTRNKCSPISTPTGLRVKHRSFKLILYNRTMIPKSKRANKRKSVVCRGSSQCTDLLKHTETLA